MHRRWQGQQASVRFLLVGISLGQPCALTRFAAHRPPPLPTPVLVLHRAQYRHAGGPEQSPGEAMHAWVKRGDRWVLVGWHSARFEAY